jgi:hypothetical protein
MHLVDTDGHVSNQFDEGDPGVPRLPTVIDSEIMNAFQNELANIVLAHGFSLVKNTNTQVMDIVSRVIAGLTPGHRLSLTTAVPVTTSDVTGAATIYYTSLNGYRIPLRYTVSGAIGTNWIVVSTGELSQALSDNTKSPAAATTNSNYDMFVWIDSGFTVRCTRGPAWASDTSRGTGAGTTELDSITGRYVNKVAITNGPGAGMGLYVGTIRTDGSSQCNDSMAKRHLWNAYNQVSRSMQVIASGDWNYSTNTWRQAGGASTNQLDFVLGLSGYGVTARVSVGVKMSDVASAGKVGITLDATTAPGTSTLTGFCLGVVALYQTIAASWSNQVALGRHFLAWVEAGSGTATTSWLSPGGAIDIASGIQGEVMA